MLVAARNTPGKIQTTYIYMRTLLSDLYARVLIYIFWALRQGNASIFLNNCLYKPVKIIFDWNSSEWKGIYKSRLHTLGPLHTPALSQKLRTELRLSPPQPLSCSLTYSPTQSMCSGGAYSLARRARCAKSGRRRMHLPPLRPAYYTTVTSRVLLPSARTIREYIYLSILLPSFFSFSFGRKREFDELG